MTLPSWRFCRCNCHAGEPAPISDRMAAAMACVKCADDHVQKYEKDPPFRKEKFDLPEPFHPPRPADATGTVDEEDDAN